jgi:hypothetical protein
MATAKSTSSHIPEPATTQSCFECGAPAEYNHHVVPRTLGGIHTVPLCAACHSKIHAMPFIMHHGERTKAGLAAARARGRVGGRPRQMTRSTLLGLMEAVRAKRDPVSVIAQHYHLHRATIYSYVRPNGQPTALGQALLTGATAHAAAAD